MLMFRYCWLCLAQWKNSNGRTRGDLGTCPECREQVRSETRVLAIEHMIVRLTNLSCRILLQFVADSNRVLDKNNWSVLLYACRFGHMEMVTMLLDAGVDKVHNS